jgi:ribonucleoside-diphosphate reductase alpha chain
MMLHFQAWESGIKSLYYLRSKSVQRAGFAGGVEADNTADRTRDGTGRPDRLRGMPRLSVR